MFKGISLKLRITIVFTLIVTFLLGLFAWVIYFFSKETQEKLFFERLQERAKTTANLIVEKAELDSLSFIKAEVIFANGLEDEVIEVYNSNNQRIFSEPANLAKAPKSLDFLKDIRKNSVEEWVADGTQSLGVLSPDNQGSHIIVIEAPDKIGIQKITRLKYLLAVSLMVAGIATIIIGWIFANRLVIPFSRIITEMRDITEHNLSKRLTDEIEAKEITQLIQNINELLSRLENSFQAQKVFIANVSHEIRTPLSIILGELEIAQLQKDPEARRVQLESFREEVKRLVRLSEQLLWLAQTSRDRHEIYFSTLRMDEIIFEAVHAIPRIAKENRKVNVDYSKDPVDDSVLLVRGNADLLRALFINLIENALKYSLPQAPVSVLIDYAKDRVDITIIDRGQGIEASELQQIFKPFYRSNRAKTQASGNGIGLYLCRQIVNVHNADIKMESTIGTGTTVHLYFPQAVAEANNKS